jgi:hypothetical protein
MKLKKDFYDQVQVRWMQHYQPYDHSWNAQNELYDNGLIIWQMCFKTYILHNMCTRLNHQCKHFKNLNSIYNNLNTNEFGCTLYDIANCSLSNYTTTLNGKDIYIYV